MERLTGRLRRKWLRGIRSIQHHQMLKRLILSKRAAASGSITVSYAHVDFPRSVPGEDALISGGGVKYFDLNRYLPHAGLECHVLYVVSSSHHREISALMDKAQSCGIKVVWNQDGVYVPFAYGAEKVATGNSRMASLFHRADYVFYQSDYAKRSCDRFLGNRIGPSEVLYNAVDTERFAPGERRRNGELVLLVAGSHDSPYRLRIALETLHLLVQQRKRVRMIVAGKIHQSAQQEHRQLATSLGVDRCVEFWGPYGRGVAPDVFRSGDVFLHTQYGDVCPTVVLEAMSSGLPVIYSAAGGTPELVGDEAGWGVPAEFSWEEVRPPKPSLLAEGVLMVAESWDRYSDAARERAVSRFDLRPWLARHRAIFEMLALSRG